MRGMTGERETEWVVLDAMGVIYRIGDDLYDLMLPFLRERGCDLPDDLIETQFFRCSNGDISSEDMWHECGLDVTDGVDIEFTGRYSINPGAAKTMAALRESGVRIACLSNGPVEWSRHLRRRFGLEKWIDTWVVSGEVRRSKPDPAIFNILLAKTGTRPEKCLFVDDNPRNLATARHMGFQTYLFTTNDSAAQFAQILELAKK